MLIFFIQSTQNKKDLGNDFSWSYCFPFQQSYPSGVSLLILRKKLYQEQKKHITFQNTTPRLWT